MLKVIRFGAVTSIGKNTSKVSKFQVATLTSVPLRPRDYKRPEPFDYKNKKYGVIASIYDDVITKMDENSKLVVVDGMPGTGKTKVAKALAEAYDLLYFDPPTFDTLYFNEYGVNLKDYYDILPEKTWVYDINDFLRDPKHWSTIKMQFEFYRLKLDIYSKAIRHVVNTGHGVVLDTSVYSDMAYVDTLRHFDMISAKAKKYMTDSWNNVHPWLLRPHLVVYLDATPEEVIKTVKARNHPDEVNSPFMKPEIMDYLSQKMSTEFLEPIESHSEVLIYNERSDHEIDDIIMDIDDLDMEKYSKDWFKMYDWNLRGMGSENPWRLTRKLFTSFPHYILNWATINRLDVPELVWTAEERQQFEDVYRDQIPGNVYKYGYNAECGDKVSWFK